MLSFPKYELFKVYIIAITIRAGVSGYFCTIRSLSLVPPSTVATLRTSQVIVAFVIQVAVTGIIPGKQTLRCNLRF